MEVKLSKLKIFPTDFLIIFWNFEATFLYALFNLLSIQGSIGLIWVSTKSSVLTERGEKSLHGWSRNLGVKPWLAAKSHITFYLRFVGGPSQANLYQSCVKLKNVCKCKTWQYHTFVYLVQIKPSLLYVWKNI